QQRRDHWLARDAHSASLLNIYLQLQNTVRMYGHDRDLAPAQIKALDEQWQDTVDEFNNLRDRMRARAAGYRGQYAERLDSNLDRTGPRSRAGNVSWDDDGCADSYPEYGLARDFAVTSHKSDGDRYVVIQDDGLVLWDSDVAESDDDEQPT